MGAGADTAEASRRAALRDECRFLSSHAYAVYDAAAGAMHVPEGPVGPSMPPAEDICIAGLTVLRQYISDGEHDLLLRQATEQKPSRPAYLCGSAYEHVCMTCPQIPCLEMYVCLRSICDRLRRDGWISHMPGTLTINYYEPHEGLRPHTDNPEVCDSRLAQGDAACLGLVEVMP